MSNDGEFDFKDEKLRSLITLLKEEKMKLELKVRKLENDFLDKQWKIENVIVM